MSQRGLCIVCVDAGADFDWCRVCGRGEPEEPAVIPMSGLRLTIRQAFGGPLTSDGRNEREAFYAAMREVER